MKLEVTLLLHLICLIGSVLCGVLHHREHAAEASKSPADGSRTRVENRNPYEGSGHGKLANYVSVLPPYDRASEEKLRVIKITRTYAIPYPVPVPFPKQVNVPAPHPAVFPLTRPVLSPHAFNFKEIGPSSSHTYAVRENLHHDISNTDFGRTDYRQGQGNVLAQYQGDFSSNSLEYGSPDVFSNHGSTGSSLSSYRPFRPSPEYNPPHLNEPPYKHFSQW